MLSSISHHREFWLCIDEAVTYGWNSLAHEGVLNLHKMEILWKWQMLWLFLYWRLLTPRNTANAEHVVSGIPSAKRSSGFPLYGTFLTHSSTKLKSNPVKQQDALNGASPDSLAGWHTPVIFLVILLKPYSAPALAPRLEVSCLEPSEVCLLSWVWKQPVGSWGQAAGDLAPKETLTPILLDFSLQGQWCHPSREPTVTQ